MSVTLLAAQTVPTNYSNPLRLLRSLSRSAALANTYNSLYDANGNGPNIDVIADTGRNFIFAGAVMRPIFSPV